MKTSCPPLLLPSGKPLLQLWFGNFFEPWLSNRPRVAAAMKEIAEMGFNSINLDSKPWEDFFARYAGEPASNYVGMQEFMMEQAHALGMGHSFLAVYLNGDNLFPDLRDVPAVRGEEAIGADGKSLETYKYWSDKAQATMLDHVKGLTTLYRDGHIRFDRQGPALPIHTMFDPALKPSFDQEGRTRYMTWLEDRYGGDIAAVNARYGTRAGSFDELRPQDYWLKPDELHYVTCAWPEPEDYERATPDLYKWIDNQTWIAAEVVAFFGAMHAKYRALDPELFLFPVLAQWGMFFTPPGNRWWDMATRALDPYRVAPHLDAAMFIASPINPENDPDAAALSAEFSIMRNANLGRPFIAGLFLGRHVHADLYRTVSPAEALGTAAAHGASGITSYGYGGADDGGVIQHLDKGFKESVAIGNRWAEKVLPLVSSRRRLREAVLLFPRASHQLETMMNPQGCQHRMDLLGWYRQLTDTGLNVDILHPDQITDGTVADWSVLVLPTDSCYRFAPDPALEEALGQWVRNGGVCLHGPDNALAAAAFGITQAPAERDCLDLGHRLLVPNGWTTCAYPDTEPLAIFPRSGAIGIGLTTYGKGRVLSIGYAHGFSYGTRLKAVPYGYHSGVETVTAQLCHNHPITRELRNHQPPGRWIGGLGIETGWFEDSVVVVNHRSVPLDTSLVAGSGTHWQYDVGKPLLLPHAAVYFTC